MQASIELDPDDINFHLTYDNNCYQLANCSPYPGPHINKDNFDVMVFGHGYSVITVSNIAYMAGGYDLDNKFFPNDSDPPKPLQKFYSYNILNNTWHQLPSMLHATTYPLLIHINEHIYTIDTEHTHITKYNISNNCWETLTQPNTPITFTPTSVTSYKQHLLLTGYTAEFIAWDNPHKNINHYIFAYYPPQDTWHTVYQTHMTDTGYNFHSRHFSPDIFHIYTSHSECFLRYLTYHHDTNKFTPTIHQVIWNSDPQTPFITLNNIHEPTTDTQPIQPSQLITFNTRHTSISPKPCTLTHNDFKTYTINRNMY